MSEKQRYCIHCMEPLPESATICAHCHFDYADRQENPSHLPHTVLAGKYLVGQAIGQGGFGITYIGLDLNLQIKVAIKEYFPMGFASRTATSAHSMHIAHLGAQTPNETPRFSRMGAKSLLRRRRCWPS